ncbi:MAG: hypothetical protein P8J20_05960, partial [Novosphingobium sp.]|nr:hypothetical protein [Novosphingobium sp.]
MVAAGGIDDYFDNIQGTLVIENALGLSDPFAGITPPDNPTARTLSCSGGTTSYTATYDVDVTVTEYYYEGSKRNQMPLVGTSSPTSSSSTQTSSASANTQVGDTETTSDTQTGSVTSTGSGNNKTYYRTDQVIDTVQTVLSVVQTGSSPQMLPGTYSDFDLSCDTDLAPGVYVVDGGDLDVNAQYSLSGQGVMFVLKNGAGIKINGGADISLT